MKGAVSPEAWSNVARAGMQRIYDRSIKNGILDGALLEKNLIGPSGLGGESLTEAVGPVNAQNWIKLANAIKVRQAKSPASEGSVLIQLTQGGALLTAASIPFIDIPDEAKATAAGILLAPAAIARIMTNPASARAMIEGVKVGTVKSATVASGIVGRIMQAIIPRKVDSAKSQQNGKNINSLSAVGAR